jgi:protein O-mannosyl-transferase
LSTEGSKNDALCLKPLPERISLGQAALICVVLIALTFGVFGRTGWFGFVNWDDPAYVSSNPIVRQGLTLKGVRWAFTFGGIGHWHPLTWLSHMADCTVFGANPGGPHLVNVALHALAAAILFLTFCEMTGRLWPCAFVAAVFAIHPLRAESVAWIAERKDVLSGVFFMLTLWAYVRFARKTSLRRYALMTICFALGLLCKNTLVTLPFVLLLLDWWPLGRMKKKWAGDDSSATSFWSLAREKVPLLMLSAGSCVATFLTPEKVAAIDQVPFLQRVDNAVISYIIYLRQTFFPAGLAALYPNPPGGHPPGKVVMAIVLLTAVSVAIWKARRRCPYLLMGWLWYLGMLVPAIGLVQISYYSHADRYTYLPGIGLVLAITWGAVDLSSRWDHRQGLLGGLAAILIAALAVCAWRQTGFWRDSETLWIHALACTTNNYSAENNLGLALMEEGRMEDAMGHFQEALRINPKYAAVALDNLGQAALRQGKLEEARQYFQSSLEAKPDFAPAHDSLGYTLSHMGNVGAALAESRLAVKFKPDQAEFHVNYGDALLQNKQLIEAESEFQTALEMNPFLASAHNGLGGAFLRQGETDAAVTEFQAAIQQDPRLAEAHYNLANALLRLGRVSDAIGELELCLKIAPSDSNAQTSLAWLLAAGPNPSLRDGKKAVELAQQANSMTGGKDPMVLHTLAAAFAETGQFNDAKRAVRAAIALAQANGRMDQSQQLNEELKRYEAGVPLHP